LQGRAFWGLVDIASHLGSQVTQKPILGDVNTFFKPNMPNIETFIRV